MRSGGAVLVAREGSVVTPRAYAVSLVLAHDQLARNG